MIITTIMIISCFFDFKTRKIPNAVNLFIFVFSLIIGIYINGFSALSSFVIISISLLPLYILGIFGGGDYKLFSSLSFLIPMAMYVDLMLYTLIWAAMYSLLKIITTHKVNLPYSLYANWRRVLNKNKIPMTLPYLLAWLSLLQLGAAI